MLKRLRFCEDTPPSQCANPRIPHPCKVGTELPALYPLTPRVVPTFGCFTPRVVPTLLPALYPLSQLIHSPRCTHFRRFTPRVVPTFGRFTPRVVPTFIFQLVEIIEFFARPLNNLFVFKKISLKKQQQKNHSEHMVIKKQKIVVVFLVFSKT